MKNHYLNKAVTIQDYLNLSFCSFIVVAILMMTISLIEQNPRSTFEFLKLEWFNDILMTYEL